jgi:hypothetical protein
MPSREIEDFIARWSAASQSERANAQLLLSASPFKQRDQKPSFLIPQSVTIKGGPIQN